MIGWFGSRRRQVERELRLARDELQAEVLMRTEQASLLDLTHDSIFVRDMNDVVTYWNRGAQESVRLGAKRRDREAGSPTDANDFPAAAGRDSRGVAADGTLGRRAQYY
jgi:PAS domain-containing protein